LAAALPVTATVRNFKVYVPPTWAGSG
jgi:hypothetical protein